MARRTGLTPATLRAWERRYGAVQPSRSGTERRLYTDADIERLRHMRALAAAGHSLPHLATLSAAELASLAGAEKQAEPVPARRSATVATAAAVLEGCERSVFSMDGVELYRLLARTLVEQGPESFVHDVAAPLCRRIGDLWEQRALTVAQEHVASVAIRQSLDFLLDKLRNPSPSAPHIVLTTPAGERHEFGAMMAGAIALTAGWRVTYLGPDLPARDIATAARASDARAIAISIVSLRGDPRVAEELKDLRAAAGDDVAIVVGGACAGSYEAALEDISAFEVTDLRELHAVLAEIRQPALAS